MKVEEGLYGEEGVNKAGVGREGSGADVIRVQSVCVRKYHHETHYYV